MHVNFAMKETVMNLYSVDIPKEMEKATDKEILEWINSGEAFNYPIEYLKDIDLVESELATDYRFEVVR